MLLNDFFGYLSDKSTLKYKEDSWQTGLGRYCKINRGIVNNTIDSRYFTLLL